MLWKKAGGKGWNVYKKAIQTMLEFSEEKHEYDVVKILVIALSVGFMFIFGCHGCIFYISL